MIKADRIGGGPDGVIPGEDSLTGALESDPAEEFRERAASESWKLARERCLAHAGELLNFVHGMRIGIVFQDVPDHPANTCFVAQSLVQAELGARERTAFPCRSSGEFPEDVEKESEARQRFTIDEGGKLIAHSQGDSP